MYVYDMTLDEAEDMAETLAFRLNEELSPEEREQAEWDYEDVLRRIQELDPEADTE